MNWEKRSVVTKILKITRKDVDGNTSRWVEEDDFFITDEGEFEPVCERERRFEISLTFKDREIYLAPHTIEHYVLTLRCEPVAGTLGLNSDVLKIDVDDGGEVYCLGRYMTDSGDFNKSRMDDVEVVFSFEKNRLIAYSDGYRDCPITRGKEYVTEDILNPHYESFKRIRPDIAQSLEACLNELKDHK